MAYSKISIVDSWCRKLERAFSTSFETKRGIDLHTQGSTG